GTSDALGNGWRSQDRSARAVRVARRRGRRAPPRSGRRRDTPSARDRRGRRYTAAGVGVVGRIEEAGWGMTSIPNAQRPTPKGAPVRACSSLGVGGWKLGVCVIALLTSACFRQQPSADPNIITIAARVGPNSLHPLKANDEGTARVGQLMYDSLMDNGDDLRAHPRLAERVEMADPMTWI